MRRADAARLLLLAAIWGASFLFMRIVAPALGPIATADLRMLLGGAALAAYFWLTGYDPSMLGGAALVVLGTVLVLRN